MWEWAGFIFILGHQSSSFHDNAVANNGIVQFVTLLSVRKKRLPEAGVNCNFFPNNMGRTIWC
jgi:hypothetical protein